MTALTSSFVSVTNPKIQSLSGSLLEPMNQSLLSPRNLSFNPIHQRKAKLSTYNKSLVVRASRDSAGIFVGGFVLGGIVAGTLGCVYAPQISKALSGAPDKKEFMRKLPKFIYDEEKALEKTRQILTEKIAQLSSAIDDVSSQLRSDSVPNGVATTDIKKGFASSSGNPNWFVDDDGYCIEDVVAFGVDAKTKDYKSSDRSCTCYEASDNELNYWRNKRSQIRFSRSAAAG